MADICDALVAVHDCVEPVGDGDDCGVPELGSNRRLTEEEKTIEEG